MEKEEIGCTFQEKQIQGEDPLNAYGFSLKIFLTLSCSSKSWTTTF